MYLKALDSTQVTLLSSLRLWNNSSRWVLLECSEKGVGVGRGDRHWPLSVMLERRTLLDGGIQGPLPTRKESAMECRDENMDPACRLVVSLGVFAESTGLLW